MTAKQRRRRDEVWRILETLPRRNWHDPAVAWAFRYSNYTAVAKAKACHRCETTPACANGCVLR